MMENLKIAQGPTKLNKEEKETDSCLFTRLAGMNIESNKHYREDSIVDEKWKFT